MNLLNRRDLFSYLVGIALALSLTACSSQNRSGTYVTMLGRDTLAVEEFSRTATALTGTSIARNPQTTVRKYTATYGGDGSLQRFYVSFQPFGENPRFERTYVYADDSVSVTTKRDTLVRTYTAAVSGRPYPFFEDIFAGWNEAIRMTMEDSSSTLSILAGRGTLDYLVQRNDDGTIDLQNDDFGPMHVTPAMDGGFDVFDMTATTDKYLVTRGQHIDLDAVGASFAAMDKAGMGMGTLSPRDTARATVGRAHVMIDYGRPSLRGRTIFGNIVPWGEVWRTGANQATQLVTDRTLTFGKTSVRPGTYSLFTLPREDGWTLIINNQHGQWGTVYDESKDLVRLPMKVSEVMDPVEQFTITINGSGSNGSINLNWENTNASVEFRSRER